MIIVINMSLHGEWRKLCGPWSAGFSEQVISGFSKLSVEILGKVFIVLNFQKVDDK